MDNFCRNRRRPSPSTTGVSCTATDCLKRCACVAGRPFRLAQHLERLARGADFLKIKLPFTPGELEKFAGQLIEKNKMPEAVLRVTLTRGPGERGYTPPSVSRPTIVMTLHAMPRIGTSGSLESDHVVVSHSGKRPAVVLQNNEQADSRDGARRKPWKRARTRRCSQHERRSGRNGQRQFILGL